MHDATSLGDCPARQLNLPAWYPLDQLSNSTDMICVVALLELPLCSPGQYRDQFAGLRTGFEEYIVNQLWSFPLDVFVIALSMRAARSVL